MNKLFLHVVVLWSLAACATRPTDAVPSASQVPGTYSMGDGLGICMEVTLKRDGVLEGVACGGEHIDLPSREFSGTWSAVGASLHINTPGNEIGESELFFWQGAPAFVEVENKRGNRVEQWAIFSKSTR